VCSSFLIIAALAPRSPNPVVVVDDDDDDDDDDEVLHLHQQVLNLDLHGVDGPLELGGLVGGDTGRDDGP